MLAIALLIIALTVFNPKTPHLSILSLHIHTFSATSPPPSYTPTVKLALNLRISIHNPNYAALHYSSDSATSIFYHGQLAGQAPIAAGAIPARQTRYLTSIVNFRGDKIVTNPNLLPDFNSGEFPISTQTAISGKVSVLKVLKRHTVAASACNVSLSVRSQSLEYFICNYPTRL
ncbi:hypothetical protein O6H91_02G045300 [Diphasiastrum complanatum]|nr:hypothetical protein O6H91_02G045300 [Diphasiastrum complanatum]